MPELTARDADSILKQASELIFSCGVGDAAEDLGRWVTMYGLAKMIVALRELGLPDNPTFIGSPDMTVTRNKERFIDGFGYGGLLSWGDGAQELIFLNCRPNACGYLLVGLQEQPDAGEFIKKCEALSREQFDWDIASGNHFILIGKIKYLEGVNPHYPYFCLIHAGSAYKSPNAYGPGLYLERSPELQSWAKTVETPWGNISFLRGEYALRYYDFYRLGERKAKEQRLNYAKQLFSDKIFVFGNYTHQGLWSMNEQLLGCFKHNARDESFPVALNPNTSAYLVKGLHNLRPAVIAENGWMDNATKHTVQRRLETANIVPHGGGYAFPQYEKVESIVEFGARRLYVLKLTDSENREVTEYPCSSYAYRDDSVIGRMWEYGLASPYAKLIPTLSLKL